MNTLKITVSTLIILIISACSTPGTSSSNSDNVESKIFDYKAPPTKAHSLDVPPDLTSYVGDDRYGIPGDGESGTRYSDYLQGGGAHKASSVLPPVKDVQLEKNGKMHWLVVKDKPENIWPVIKEFWQANGLTIKNENPQAGVMETEWAENRAKVPMDSFKKTFGKVFDGLLSSGESDQYLTRLERSKDGNSTEVYITHYGMQVVVSKDESGYRWLPRPSDPELEVTMLQLLMSKLGGGSGVLDSTKKPADIPVTNVVSAPKLNKLADGSESILLSEPFDKSWRKVGLALEQAKIMLADKDRSKGIYFLSAGKDDVKSKQDSGKIVRMQVNVRESNSGCEVTVNDGAGGNNAETQKVTDTLFKSLGRL